MGLFNMQRQSDEGFKFRSMARRDVEQALEIVYAHDEDDGEEAAESLSGDLSAYYVVEIDGALAGFSGYNRIMESPTSAWLSWTYVDENFRRNGVGSYLIAELSRLLIKRGVERLFISTSDYTEDGVDIYAQAKRFYERLGARCDLKIPDFYQPGEAKYIYRLTLGEQGYGFADTASSKIARFIDAELIDETQSAWCLLWEEYETSSASMDDRSTDNKLDLLIEQVLSEGAHAIFASLPVGLSSAASMELQRGGFRQLGSVNDYYGPGNNEVYWGYYPDQQY